MVTRLFSGFSAFCDHHSFLVLSNILIGLKHSSKNKVANLFLIFFLWAVLGSVFAPSGGHRDKLRFKHLAAMERLV